MQIIRRTFLSLLAVLCRPWRVGAVAALPTATAPVPTHFDSWAKKPDHAKDLIWFVHGGTMATLHVGPPASLDVAGGEYVGNVPPTPTILTLRPCYQGDRSREDRQPPETAENRIWFEMPRGGYPDNLWPRATAFAVQHEIVIGTIDDIVEDFRRRLTDSAKFMLYGQTQDLTRAAPMWGDNNARGEAHYWAIQEELRERLRMHQSPSPVAHLPIPYNEPEMARFDQELEARGGRYGTTCNTCRREYRFNHAQEAGTCPQCRVAELQRSLTPTTPPAERTRVVSLDGGSASL